MPVGLVIFEKKGRIDLFYNIYVENVNPISMKHRITINE